MLTENINTLPLPELMDLLSNTTLELLNAMQKKGADGIMINDKRKDVQLLQSVISTKKSANSPGVPKSRYSRSLVLS